MPELELVATGHPYHEPLWAALARALYATDRQTDALDRLTTLRRTILDDLGLDPTPMIGELERRILTQDPDLAARSTALAPLSVGRAVRSHLPTLRPLIGRDELITDLEPLIEAPGQITLLGPAGVGKTALAVSLAHRAASSRRDGATFVDLAPLATGDDVVLAVAAAVSLRPDSVDAAREDLCDLLASRDALLVLDNCEHVRDDVASLLDDLAGARPHHPRDQSGPDRRASPNGSSRSAP